MSNSPLPIPFSKMEYPELVKHVQELTRRNNELRHSLDYLYEIVRNIQNG